MIVANLSAVTTVTRCCADAASRKMSAMRFSLSRFTMFAKAVDVELEFIRSQDGGLTKRNLR